MTTSAPPARVPSSTARRGAHRAYPRRRAGKRLREQLVDRLAVISVCVLGWVVLRLVDTFHPLTHLLTTGVHT